MRHEGVAVFTRGKLRLLHLLNVVLHALTLRVGVRQVEHVEPHAVDACQGNELVFVAHVGQLLLETGDGFVIQLFLPVEGRRAVVGQQLARVFRVDGVGKAFCQRQIRRGGFTPDQIRIRRVRQATADRLFNAGMGTVEAFTGTLACDELAVVRVAVRGDQVRRVRIGTGNHQRRHAEHVSSQTRRNQLLYGFLCRNEHLTAHVSAFLH